MPQTNHGSIEFLKFPDPQYPGDNTRLIKKWLRDSWARRKLASLIQDMTWEAIPSVVQGTAKSLSEYREVIAYCTFSAGQCVCFHIIKPLTGTARQDSGFYYTPSACGGGAITWTASGSLTIYQPFYGGQATNFASIVVFARKK